MRVLIVDDDKDIVSFLKKSFEAEAFAVDTAFDGERGSYAARTNTYDLIILDNIMPKKGGLEVSLELRAAGKSMPILMLSVKSEVPEKVALLNAGVDDYMTKPYSFEEILARSRALLRRGAGARTNRIEVGDLVIDASSQEVSRGGVDIYLTRKEFSLLELLARHKGRVVSRGTIMEHVWDMEGDPFSRTIETHILNLRKKLEQGGKPKLITNLPGRGYKIA